MWGCPTHFGHRLPLVGWVIPGDADNGKVEDVAGAGRMLMSSPTLAGLAAAFYITLMLYNPLSQNVALMSGSTMRIFMSALRTIGVWAGGLLQVGWGSFALTSALLALSATLPAASLPPFWSCCAWSSPFRPRLSVSVSFTPPPVSLFFFFFSLHVIDSQHCWVGTVARCGHRTRTSSCSALGCSSSGCPASPNRKAIHDSTFHTCSPPFPS